LEIYENFNVYLEMYISTCSIVYTMGNDRSVQLIATEPSIWPSGSRLEAFESLWIKAEKREFGDGKKKQTDFAGGVGRRGSAARQPLPTAPAQPQAPWNGAPASASPRQRCCAR